MPGWEVSELLIDDPHLLVDLVGGLLDVFKFRSHLTVAAHASEGVLIVLIVRVCPLAIYHSLVLLSDLPEVVEDLSNLVFIG